MTKVKFPSYTIFQYIKNGIGHPTLLWPTATDMAKALHND